MSQLVVVRHGQADAFSADSDRLTPLGEKQARMLGEHWVAAGVTFDDVVIGALRRHAQTEEQVAAAYAAAGRAWPARSVDAGWNEYDAHAITGAFAPALAERNAEFRKLVDDFGANAGGPERNRYFQRMFEVLMASWIAGDVEAPGVEPFEVFHARVSAAADRVLSSAGSRRVAVFSSGGPIGVCVQRAVKAPKSTAMEVNWRVRNSSLTEFLFGRGRVSLDLFNAVPHLTDPALVTYR
jgi:broad specificity phosphatase PhoE